MTACSRFSSLRSTGRAIVGITQGLACASLILGTCAWAEWTRIDDDDKVAGYVDLTTIRKEGNRVEVSSLLAFDGVQRKDGRLYLSLTVEFEIDCRDHRSRILAVAAHSENIGQVEVVISESLVDRPWESIRPRSRSESLWQIACRHKAASAGRSVPIPVVLNR